MPQKVPNLNVNQLPFPPFHTLGKYCSQRYLCHPIEKYAILPLVLEILLYFLLFSRKDILAIVTYILYTILCLTSTTRVYLFQLTSPQKVQVIVENMKPGPVLHITRHMNCWHIMRHERGESRYDTHVADIKYRCPIWNIKSDFKLYPESKRFNCIQFGYKVFFADEETERSYHNKRKTFIRQNDRDERTAFDEKIYALNFLKTRKVCTTTEGAPIPWYVGVGPFILTSVLGLSSWYQRWFLSNTQRNKTQYFTAVIHRVESS